MQIYPQPVLVDEVTGDTTGLVLPAHAEALRAAGPEFLTRAFQAYGSLAADNRVTRIIRFEPCHAGNSGHKLFLSVEYERPDPGLHGDLFVKFSRDFGDAFRDRRRYELEPEIRLMSLARRADFPVRVSKPYFGDFAHGCGTGLLITERIAFGEDGVEPPRAKNMDHELADPVEYYRATLTALAQLAAAHQSGRLSPEADISFPFEVATAAPNIPVPYDAAELETKLDRFAAFAAEVPQILPGEVVTPDFIARFRRQAPRFLQHQGAISGFLHSDPRFVALGHHNVHLDNAWFWRDGAGLLRCGLLDWGLVRQMNLGYGVWGSVSSANLAFWSHIDGLLAEYVETLRAQGGADIAPADLILHFELSAAMLSMALYIDAPALIRSRMPDVGQAKSPLDPLLARDSVVHGFLNGFSNFLYLWATRDFGASLDRMLAGSR